MLNRTSAVLLGLFLIFVQAAPAAADQFDGDYRVVEPPQPTQTGDKIEVLEIFWYGCPHCYHFESYIHKWLQTKPDDVAFRRMPAVISKNWLPHARAYYAAVKLGVLDQIHTPLFNAIHRDRKPIFSESQLKDFFVSLGIDGDRFEQAYNSNEVDTKIKQAFYMERNYKITGVPTVVVGGKYLTSAMLTGSFEKMIDTVNYLIKKVRSEQKK